MASEERHMYLRIFICLVFVKGPFMVRMDDIAAVSAVCVGSGPWQESFLASIHRTNIVHALAMEVSWSGSAVGTQSTLTV